MNDTVTATTSTATLSQLSADDLAKVERVRELIRLGNKTTWDIGDLILEIAGPAGTSESDGRLRAAAAAIGQSESWAARMRGNSEAFPPNERSYDLPWRAYELSRGAANRHRDLADTILQGVVVNTTNNAKAYSEKFVGEVRDEVLKHNGREQRLGPRLSHAELFARAIKRFRPYAKNSMSVSEARAILDEWREIEPTLKMIARSR